MRVVAIIHEADGGFGVSFPDFPGCVSGGDTMDEALAASAEALTAHVGVMIEVGEPIPAPRTLDALRSDLEFAEDFEGGVVATVPLFNPPQRAQRVNVTIEGGLLEEIDRAARTYPGGRSGFLAAAAREKLLHG